MTVLTKQNAYTLLNFDSVDSLNLSLLELAKFLAQSGKDVPAEIDNPEAYDQISKDHLTLLRDFIKGVLSADQPSTTKGQLTEAPHTEIQDALNAVAPGTLTGFRETLKQLGSEYVAVAAAYDISDSFFLALDKSLAERNEQNLRDRIDTYRSEFQAAADSIQQLAQEREGFNSSTLGKFTSLANFKDLDETLASLRK